MAREYWNLPPHSSDHSGGHLSDPGVILRQSKLTISHLLTERLDFLETLSDMSTILMQRS